MTACIAIDIGSGAERAKSQEKLGIARDIGKNRRKAR